MRRVEAKRVKKDVQIKLDPAGDMAALDKPVLTLSVSATMVHLKKYIKGQLKLDIPPDAVRNLMPMQDDEFMAHVLFSPFQLEILYQGEVLGAEHSLEYVLKTRVQSDNRPTFTYRQKSL